MKLKAIIQRKFRRRWSDLELLVLLEIGTGDVSYAQLVERTGGSTSGIWNCLQNHLLAEGLAEAVKSGGKTIYSLTAKGKAALTEFLK